MSTPNPFFDRVAVINLARRPDRLAAITAATTSANWPFIAPTIQTAVDGQQPPPPPTGWTQTLGLWGCLQSHRAALAAAVAAGSQCLLVLEDDATLAPTFSVDAPAFLAALPSDWEGAMLGGLHLSKPSTFAPGVVRATRAHNTHAYALRGAFIATASAFFAASNQTAGQSWIALQTGHAIYAPPLWLVGQAAGVSDDIISRKPRPLRFFNPPPPRTGGIGRARFIGKKLGQPPPAQ